jgi:hypothetical protein
MKPAQYTVTSANTPLTIALDHLSEWTGIVALPSGSGNYDIAFARAPVFGSPTWVDLPNMSAATTTQDEVVNTITGIRITLNSGTNVVVDVCQSNPHG